MKIGDLVEFKPGTFGIDSPENLGIVLDRKSKKPHVIVTLLTVKGKLDTRADKLTKRKFDVNVDLSKKKKVSMDELKARLREWIKEFSADHERKEDEVEISERILWDAMKGIPQPLTAREIAEAFYGTSDLKKRHLKKVSDILNNCIPTGVGYFERVSTGPSRWMPLTEEEYKRINQEITRLGSLKKKMLTTVTEFDEELGESVTRVVPVPLEELELSDEDKAILRKMQEWMASFVVHDQWSQVGLAGTRTHTIDNFSLGRFLKWFVEDWTQMRGTTIANMFTAFLLGTGYWEPKDAVEAIARRVINQTPGFEWDTPESIERLAEQYPEPNDSPELWEGRVDLRDLETYTIDPPTAKDFDDAISFIPHADGSVTLYVHIADVANYVKKDSLLDTHAFKRSTSVYLPVKVLPMLPSRLSDDLCSLRENLVRLAMTVKIEFDKDGNQVSAEPMESIIRVDGNLSYDEVNQWIEEGKEPFKGMNDFAVKLWNKRLGLELETAEARLEFGVDSIGVSIKEGSASTKMIETFMVAANEAIARFLLDHEVIGIYRCHPLPDKTGVEKFNHQATALRLHGKIDLPELPERFRQNEGSTVSEEEEDNILDMLKSGGTLELGGFGGITIKKKGKKKKKGEESEPEPEPEPESVPESREPKEASPITVGIAQLTPEEREQWLKPFNEVIKEIKSIDDDLRQQVSFLTLLRVLGRAIYTPGNIGHFGLGSEAYTHFTSPIRRYADLVAHRLVKGILRGEVDHDRPLYSVEEMERVASHTTEQSILAESVERQVVASGLTIYTRDDESWREPQRAIVSALTSGGAFVLLRDSVEGKIPIQEITSERTFIDESESMLFTGTSNPERIIRDLKPENWKEIAESSDDPITPVLQLGDELLVTLTNWDYIDGKILVKPIEHLTDKPENNA